MLQAHQLVVDNPVIQDRRQYRSPDGAVPPQTCGGNLGVAPFAQRTVEIFFDLHKSVVDADTGRVWVRGVCADETLDLTNEVTKLSNLEKALQILNNGWGKLNYEHHDEIIGEITRCEVLSASEAARRFGRPFKGTAIYIEGFIYPLTPSAGPDLRQVHAIIEAAGRLGFSLHGKIMQKVPVKLSNGRTIHVIRTAFVNQVAVTPQPINMNTFCEVFKKSLAGLLTEGSIFEVTNPDGANLNETGGGESGGESDAPLLFIGEADSELLKSMVATGAIPTAGTTGADATKVSAPQAPDAPGQGKKQRKCRDCEGVFLNGDTCPNCGQVYRESLEKPLEKSLEKSFPAAIGDFVTGLRGIGAPSFTAKFTDSISRFCMELRQI